MVESTGTSQVEEAEVGDKVYPFSYFLAFR
jgi:hypothetical protein